MKAALAEPDVRERIVADGAEPMPTTPAEYAADIDREETKWSAIVKLSGAKVEVRRHPEVPRSELEGWPQSCRLRGSRARTQVTLERSC